MVAVVVTDGLGDEGGRCMKKKRNIRNWIERAGDASFSSSSSSSSSFLDKE